MGRVRVERIELPQDQLPRRWYNALPDLPRMPDPLLDPATGEAASTSYLRRLLPRTILAQDTAFDRWVEIPEPVHEAYKLWRPTPLMRARALEEHLGTPAEIYFKYEAGSPTGSHKLNSALAQAYAAGLEGVERLVTDTGAGQWGSALALAAQMFGLESLVFMVRASYEQKPYRRTLMQTFGADVAPSPGRRTTVGRALLEEYPDHPGSEATAVSEALETVYEDDASRLAIGGFGNAVLLHQTVIGLETQAQLDLIDRDPDVLIASCGCGSNLGGLVLPSLGLPADRRPRAVAVEPTACPTLTSGSYRYDYPDTSGLGPLSKTYTLGHDFIPPPIHAGGLRYHGVAPLIGLLRAEGMLDAVAYPQDDVFEAGTLFTKLTGLLPAPETAHAIRGVIDVALRCKEEGRREVIVFCFSGHGLLDLGAYAEFLSGRLSLRSKEPAHA